MKNPFKSKSLSIILTIIIAIEIFLMSSVPFESSQLPTTPYGINPSVAYHIIVFFLFTFFLTYSLKIKKEPRKIFASLIISISYAILDEVHQIFVPGRVAGIKDLFTDLIGILIAILVYFFIEKNSN